MKTRPFSPRRLFLLLTASTGLLILAACGAPAATEEAATEAPADSTTIAAITEPVSIQATSTPVLSGTSVPVTATPGILIPVTGGNEPAPALPEFRFLTLEYPPTIKLGSGSDVIILTLDVDAQGNITPTAQIEGNVVEGDVIEIPNLYDTHNVTAEAYIQMAGLEIDPPGSTFLPLKQGRAVKFTWTIRADKVGPYQGAVHLFLNFENRETAEKDRIEVSVQFPEITVVDFFGFSTDFVKTSGVVGSVLGTVVGFPFFKDIVKYLFERLTKNKKKSGKAKKKK